MNFIYFLNAKLCQAKQQNSISISKIGEKFTDASDNNDKSDAKSCSSTIESLETVSNQSKSSNKHKDHHKSFPDIASNTKTCNDFDFSNIFI